MNVDHVGLGSRNGIFNNFFEWYTSDERVYVIKENT